MILFYYFWAIIISLKLDIFTTSNLLVVVEQKYFELIINWITFYQNSCNSTFEQFRCIETNCDVDLLTFIFCFSLLLVGWNHPAQNACLRTGKQTSGCSTDLERRHASRYPKGVCSLTIYPGSNNPILEAGSSIVLT